MIHWISNVLLRAWCTDTHGCTSTSGRGKHVAPSGIARYMTKTTNNQYHLPCVCRVLVEFCCIYKRKRGKINTKPECNAILFCAIGVTLTQQPYNTAAVWTPHGLLLCQRLDGECRDFYIHEFFLANKIIFFATFGLTCAKEIVSYICVFFFCKWYCAVANAILRSYPAKRTIDMRYVWKGYSVKARRNMLGKTNSDWVRHYDDSI